MSKRLEDVYLWIIEEVVRRIIWLYNEICMRNSCLQWSPPVVSLAWSLLFKEALPSSWPNIQHRQHPLAAEPCPQEPQRGRGNPVLSLGRATGSPRGVPRWWFAPRAGGRRRGWGRKVFCRAVSSWRGCPGRKDSRCSPRKHSKQLFIKISCRPATASSTA